MKPASCQCKPQAQAKVRVAKPKWLKQKLPTGSGYEETRRLLKNSGLHTVCQEARCPNQFECFGKGTATFMLMGENCTRNCRFCAVAHAGTKPLDPDEPVKIARAVHDMKLNYAVLTSVTRDDLPDGGAEHFARTIDAIRETCSKALIEVLIPDLQGDKAALELLCRYKPSVLNHNIETVASLYSKVRPQALYHRSLELLKNVKKINPNIVTKSGLMLGLGESLEELKETMSDIKNTGCDLLTLGQYLQPTTDNLEVYRYVPPEEFENIRETALELGFSGVAAGPHVRSSYQAGELYKLAI
jgi:lipoic acid synthetase